MGNAFPSFGHILATLVRRQKSSPLALTQSCKPLKSSAHAAPLSNYTNPTVFDSCILREYFPKTDGELISFDGGDNIVNDEADVE